MHRRHVMRKMSARSLADLISMEWRLQPELAPRAVLQRSFVSDGGYCAVAASPLFE
ncbi:hypothetical protein [Paraburkholderia youngii]|uniref:hypothetical protein n=1 Tax=Paraburkholderia youngii TaxID=2782701 RepID=UPI003D1BA2B2